jgi:hypothetical protein
MYLHSLFPEDAHIKRARSAAAWLDTRASHPCGGVRTRDYYSDMDESEHYSFESGNIYSFDNGMVLYGLLNLYRKSREEKFLEQASRIADFLTEVMRRPDGGFYAVYSPNSDMMLDAGAKWSDQSGSFHSKLALGLIDMSEITGVGRYKEAAVALCENSLGFQRPDGRFVTEPSEGSTHLHPHLYSAEGLFYAGKKLGIRKYAAAAEKAVTWAFDNMRPDGIIPKKFGPGGPVRYYRSDTLAQALRLGLLLRSGGGPEDISEDKLMLLKNSLLRLQYAGKNEQAGGFLYGYTLTGEKKDHINSWCTMFALQALMMYDLYEKGELDTEMECFV